MSSIGVVVFRNSTLGRAQVLQETVNNSLNISNNEANKTGKREIIILRKKQKIQIPTTVSVTSLVRAAETATTAAPAKRPRIRDDSSDDQGRAPTPLAVARRNARERNRVRQVNDGFAALRRHIPEEVASAFETANSNRGSNKKLSKVETLRMAVEYIRNLETLLNIGHSSDKENSTRQSMESFPSPASSSPRDNSQERSYFSLNSPVLDDEDIDDEDLDGSVSQLPQQQYINLSAPDALHLVSSHHLYEEEDGAQPLTPSSDLLTHDEVNPHFLEGNFQFPASAEHFTVIPEQSYCSESEVPVNESDFEIKYSHSLHSHINTNFSDDVELPLEAINPDMILGENQYKFKEEDFLENQQYSTVELKKELPDIHVTPEDREQFEETLKWWQEKTRQARPLINSKNN